ncbi:Serine/threonine-protein kinase PknA [Anatilimnocola aggregata]|uniref:Serine/threonine-protein kinase PknA n=1 Tax=Anatilimnocola aggregata TaxID=2528021 RepID=A0A517YEZ2_9BACT|nr:protein kinase [Anatilimnocola aggregata]QDU28722.1 Serine/threonine-protein kinase PknA [Anatilimnocola aggregata]
MAPSRMSLSFKIGDQPVPGYRLVRELGRGTFGVVWLAVTENGFERALKVVNLEQKGGKKEFRALRLIKDRKILHGNLLTLIDYWLLDRDGTIIATPGNVNLDTQISPLNKAGSAPGNLAATTEPAKTQPAKLTPLAGTMMPGGEGDTAFNVRDTFQQSRLTDTTEEINNSAIWLVVAMELGHKTLHDRQREHTTELNHKTLSKVSRRGVTAIDAKGDTSPGSHTAFDKHPPKPDAEDDLLASLPADEVLPYMEQAARGLDYLHRCEIVHRDVKPQNIMLVGDVAKVCDYGLASELGDMRATTNAFTLPYAAPEAINNRPCPASDQYSLAVSYVELRTGRWPFVSNTATAVYGAKESGNHHLKFVPKRAVRAVLKKALFKNPNDRYSTCGEFVKQLTKAEHSRSSVFAMVQFVLAIIAIVTVLLAAAATHPDIQARMLSIIDSFRSTDAKEFERRLRVAERQVMDEKHADALGEFESLYRDFPGLSPDDNSLRYDAIIGRARAELGGKDALQDAQVQDAIGRRIDELPSDPQPPLSDLQKLRVYYLQLIAKRKTLAIGGLDPNSAPAQEALASWERALWARALQASIEDRRVPPNLKESLRTVIAERKAIVSPEDFQKAKASLAQMLAVAKESLSEEDEFWHAIKLEELHLAFKHPEPNHEQNLRSLDALLANRLQQDRQAIIRGQLLRLLILSELKASQPSFFEEPIYLTIIYTDGGLAQLQETSDSLFSIPEINALKDLRQRFKNEIRDWAEPIPEAAFPAVTALCGKLETFDLLRHRLNKHLEDKTLGEKQLLAVQASWADLNKLLTLDYKLDSAEAADLKDLSLSVSFADPQEKPEVALKDFVQRVRDSRHGAKWMKRLLDRAQQNPVWVDAAIPALKELSLEPTEDLALDENFDRWRADANNLTLTGILAADLGSPAAVKKIIDRLDQAADQNRPLPALVRIECELLTTPKPDDNQRRGWLARIRATLEELEETDSYLAGYGEFLRARLLASSSKSFDRDDAGKIVLAMFKQTETPAWLTSWRKQAAGDILSGIALSALGKDDSDILQFHVLNLSAQTQLEEVQTVVAKAGLQTNALLAVSAIVEATHAEKSDWKKVGELARRCQQDSKTRELLQSQNRLLLLDYVEALSNLRLAPQDRDLPPQIILAFQRILFAREGNEPRFFQFDSAQTTDDGGIFRNLVLPIVSHPSFSKSTKTTPEARLALGAIWGAKGRLLQRDNKVVVHDPLRKVDKRDTTTVALVLAHDAFRRARECQPDYINYVVGFGRTLIELPSTDIDPEKRAELISQIVDQYDPDGKSSNLGMLSLGAYVRRYQAHEQTVQAQQLRLSNEAIRRYQLVLDGTKNNDPFEIRAVCLEGLSDAHLRRAFWISKVEASEVTALLAQKTPPPNTKAFHLQQASATALEAVRMPGRTQQENAHNALGNAYEDMAFYLGMSEYYQQSVDTFETGIQLAEQEERISARAKMHLGRCLCRYGRDFLSGLSAKNRAAILERGVAHLTTSLDEAKARNRLRAETLYWRATSQVALIAYQPTKADELLQMAENDFAEAAQIATDLGTTEANYYKVEEIRVALMRKSNEGTPAVQQSAAQQRAKTSTDAIFAAAAADPKKFTITTLSLLVGQSNATFPQDQQKLKRWLPSSGPLHAHWRSNDAAKNEAAKLYLMCALLLGSKEDEQEAAALVASIADPQLKAIANASLLNFIADQQRRATDVVSKSLISVPAGPEKNQTIKKELLACLPKFREALTANDATVDAETRALLEKVNRTLLEEILAGKFDNRPNVETRQIINLVQGTLTLRDALHLVALQLSNLSTDDKEKLALLKLAHDCVKPIFLLDENNFTGLARANISAAKAKYTPILNSREKELRELGFQFD